MNVPHQKTTNETKTPRPPVVAVMGHVDHGKSTLLDYIRKTNLTAGEAGGITQRIGAYEVEYLKKETGEKRAITFLDTPGHEAFGAIRSLSSSAADIAIIVVSAEDGVMPQTIDAYSCVKNAKIPFIVAINKVDKPNADVERTKQSLAEHEIYLEGYGGDVPWVAVSAKTGSGVPELLELIDLVAELHEISGNPNSKASGFIIEAEHDPRRGPTAAALIKNGTLRQGEAVVAGEAFAVLKIIENDKGKLIKEAAMGTPVRIIGWSSLPQAGLPFVAVSNKKAAKALAEKNQETNREINIVSMPVKANTNISEAGKAGKTGAVPIVIPAIIKADASGTIEAIIHEIKKIETGLVKIKVISQGVGDISETDAKTAESARASVIIGFNVGIDSRAEILIERGAIEVKLFDVIYKLSEWLTELALKRAPKIKIEEKSGTAKVLKLFSKDKEKQIIGAKVIDGKIALGDEIKIQRREAEIGGGKIRELQRQKVRVDEVAAGAEFGALIESKIIIAPGDIIEPFKTVER